MRIYPPPFACNHGYTNNRVTSILPIQASTVKFLKSAKRTGSSFCMAFAIQSAGDPPLRNFAWRDILIAHHCSLGRDKLGQPPRRAQVAESRRMLNNKQEEALINYIHYLCERCLPPTPRIVANVAQKLCCSVKASFRKIGSRVSWQDTSKGLMPCQWLGRKRAGWKNCCLK